MKLTKATETQIGGYEGLYKVTSDGKVISLGNKSNHKLPILLKQNVDKDGYYRVVLQSNKTRKYIAVHRLVAMAFIPNPHNKPMVNHKDRNVKNNIVSNLEWVNNYENYIHSANLGFGKKEKPILQYDLENNFIAEHKSSEEAGRKSGVPQGNIINNCKKRCKSTGGYIWKYKNKTH
jgi:hypothetical protein